MSIYPEIIFEQIEIGPMENFIYFIGELSTKKVAVIDPAWDINFIKQHAAGKGFTITHLLLTHGHFDHINAIDGFQQGNLQVVVSKHEPKISSPPDLNLVKVDNGDIINIGNIALKCIHTPGHSCGSQCFKYKDILLTGDTLFIDGCGRCDLPGGNAESMFESLNTRIRPLPDSTIIFPGHDYGNERSATLAAQKKTNPYLTAETLNDFLHKRMGIPTT